MYGQNSGFGPGSQPNGRNTYGRDFSTGRMEDQPDQQQDPYQTELNNPTQQPTPQASREPQYNGSYIVIPPNQAKRDKLLTMANKEEEEYNHFLESQRPGPIHLTPEKLGGQTSQEKARQQQQLTQSQSKYQKKFQRDEYKRRQREEEEAKLQQMKDMQRKKSEKLEEKRHLEDMERRTRWQSSMLKTNSEFLDHLSHGENSSSSSMKMPSAWEQDEDQILQQVLRESLETASQQFYKPQLKGKEGRKPQQQEEEYCRTASQISYRSYKQQLKEEEERKLQEMKEEQRRKAEKLEEKRHLEDMERRTRWQSSMLKTNSEFLDHLSHGENSSSSSMNMPSAWEQDEDQILQQVLKQSLETESQQFYKPQLKEKEERKPQQQEEEYCKTASQISYRSCKQQLKEEEERKLQEMKEEQRRKSELLEVKKEEEGKERLRSQQEEQRRVNNAFLDKIQGIAPKQHKYSGESNTWA